MAEPLLTPPLQTGSFSSKENPGGAGGRLFPAAGGSGGVKSVERESKFALLLSSGRKGIGDCIRLPVRQQRQRPCNRAQTFGHGAHAVKACMAHCPGFNLPSATSRLSQ